MTNRIIFRGKKANSGKLIITDPEPPKGAFITYHSLPMCEEYRESSKMAAEAGKTIIPPEELNKD